jgi:hypothetical protein
MPHWTLRRELLGVAASLLGAGAWALLGCGDGSDTAAIHGVVGLAAVDGPALAGLTFAFPDATLFRLPGESATLQVGDAATTFSLTTSGGTVIHGTITPGASATGACRLTQPLQEVSAGQAPFAEEYDPCQAVVHSQDDLTFGAAGAGTVTLTFGRPGEPAVASSPADVLLHLREDGTVTINNNATPI